MNVLGINAYHGDAAACLLVDGTVVAAIEEERFRRIKHWAGFPSRSVRWCLERAGLRASELEHVAISRRPWAHVLDKAWYAMRTRPSTALLRDRAANFSKVRDVRSALAEALEVEPGALRARLHAVEHHRAHLASAYFPSALERAACVSLDAFGDFVSTMTGRAQGTRIQVLTHVPFPHSLGAFYTAGTQFLGFPQFGDEYKVMGLSAWGRPSFRREMLEVIRPEPGGLFRLDLAWFRHHRELADTRWDGGEPTLAPYYSERWAQRFGPPRVPGEPLADLHRDLAASIQAVAEEVVFHVTEHAARLTGEPVLCLAGGCAQNGVAVGKIVERTPFRQVEVPPAAADSGTAMGAALWVWHQVLRRPRIAPLPDAFLGPDPDPSMIRAALAEAGVQARWTAGEGSLVEEVVDHLVAGRTVAWFQGREEWGPRALGNRSILADPRRADMARSLNARVKRREEFRPFAPSVVEEAFPAYFEGDPAVPYMNRVVRVRPEAREILPAVTHVDGSARVHTVSAAANPVFHALLTAFGRRTGVPVLLNTSFNQNEPIVHTPAEAVACWRRTGIDVLVLGRAVACAPVRETA